MRTSRVLVICCSVAGIITLLWEARGIRELHAELAGVRKDLQTALERQPDKTSALSPEAAQAWREKLELIKLRNQVRELKETMVESHSGGGKVGLLAAIKALFSAPAPSGPWKLRPEWKRFETLATNQYTQAMKSLTGATNEYARFLYLNPAAKMSLVVGRTEDARQYAMDMMVLDDKYSRGIPEKANGDIVFTGNLVLGRIALDEGRTEDAKRHLLASGKTSGSPTLDSSGPNMSLAKDLLAKGDQETVLQFLDLCRSFWKSDGGKLDEWSKGIQAGRIPDFGANLLY